MLSVALCFGNASGVAAEDADSSTEAVTAYDGPVRKLFETHCVGCHNPDALEGGLDLSTHRAALAGGGSGKVIVPGSPARSRLMKLVAHEERPYMPPDSDELPAADLALLENWIRGGALESAGDQPAEPTTSPLDTVAPVPVVVSPIAGRNADELFQIVRDERAANAITALAANPHAPVVAISSYASVRLYDTDQLVPIGQLEFPEGAVHVLRFSRDGSVLLAGGGAAGRFGAVVLWDVERGRRLARIGDERDVVLAADVTHDHDFVALGGPQRRVGIYDVHTGERLHEIATHSDWITALAFSPDGALLACGDRAGTIRLVETLSGLEFAVLEGHEAAVTDIGWRGDSNLLATTSEDGSVRMWDVGTGEEVTTWPAHPEGVTAVAFTPDNLAIVTAGRDAVAKQWTTGGELQQEFTSNDATADDATADDATALTTIAISHDGTRVLAGTCTGRVHVWRAGDAATIATIEPRSQGTTNASHGAELRVAVSTLLRWLAIGCAIGCLFLVIRVARWQQRRRRDRSVVTGDDVTAVTSEKREESADRDRRAA